MLSYTFGAFGLGSYAIILAISRFSSVFVQMGHHQSIVHFMSKFNIKQDWYSAYTFFMVGVKRVIMCSLILSVALFIFRDILFETILKDNASFLTIVLISGLLLILALNIYSAATLRGLKYFKEQTILFNTVFPFLMIISLLFIKVVQEKYLLINNILSLAIIFNLIVVWFVVKSIKKKLATAITYKETKVDTKKLTRYSMPIWYNSILRVGINHSDRIMLGILSTISQVGIYSAAITFAVLFAFPLKSIGPVFQPLIVESYSKKDYEEMAILYNTVIKWSALFVVPAYGCLICFGRYFISLFGPEFQSGYGTMLVLSFAQAVSTLAGTAGNLLLMTEKQVTSAKILTLGFITGVILNWVMIPHLGAFGAAVGTGIALILINILRVLKIVKYFSINTDYPAIFKLIIIYSPIVILFLKLITMDIVHWIVIMSVYIAVSILITFFSLGQNERKYLIQKIGIKTDRTNPEDTYDRT